MWSKKMGRGKIEIKYIEKKETRQVTFSKRKNGLIKKAQELSIMCHAEVALIIFSNTGRLHQYSGHSTSVRHVIHRYLQHPQAQLRYDQIFQTTYDAGECNTFDLCRFYGQLRELIGGKLESLNADELQILEDQLEIACSKVRKKKDEVVMETFQSLRKELEESVKINRQYEKCLTGQSNTITMLGDDAVQTAQSLECHPMYSLEDKSGGMSAEIPNPPLPGFPSHTPHSYPELKLG